MDRWQPRQDTILEEGGRTDGGEAQDALVQEASVARRLLAPLLRLLPPIPPALRTLEAALQEYARLSALNSRDSQAIVEFRATEYERTEPSALQFVATRALTRSEVGEICKRLENVQDLANKAVVKVRARPLSVTPAVFGTFVHTELRDRINGRDYDNPRPDEYFKAEVSLLKTYDETGMKILERDRKDYERPHGKKGSIRLDVVESQGHGTVCVYDLKTGDSILNARRMLEIAGRVFENEHIYGPIKRVIVTETKPKPGL